MDGRSYGSAGVETSRERSSPTSACSGGFYSRRVKNRSTDRILLSQKLLPDLLNTLHLTVPLGQLVTEHGKTTKAFGRIEPLACPVTARTEAVEASPVLPDPVERPVRPGLG